MHRNHGSICFKGNRRNGSINRGLDLTGRVAYSQTVLVWQKLGELWWWRANPERGDDSRRKIQLTPLGNFALHGGELRLKQTNCETNSCLVRPREFPRHRENFIPIPRPFGVGYQTFNSISEYSPDCPSISPFLFRQVEYRVEKSFTSIHGNYSIREIN